MKFGWYLLLLILLSACSATKFLAPGQKYFEGHEAKFENGSAELPAAVRFQLLSDLKPEPTRRFFISRPGTWLYNVIDETKKSKGLKYFIKYRLGNKPSYLRDVNLDRNSAYLQDKLRANGFLRAVVVPEIDSSKYSATAVYHITLNQGYYIDSLRICADSLGSRFDRSNLCPDIRRVHAENPVIEQGMLFRQRYLLEERSNISNAFKNKGYYYFSPSYLLFKADSNDGSHSVDLHLGPKSSIPDAALRQYRYNQVRINLAAGSDSTVVIGDSLKVIIDPEKLFIKPEKLEPFIELREGDVYKRSNELLTLKQLNNLDVFEFVNLEFDSDTNAGASDLAVTILANPRPKQSLRAEANLSTTSINFTGPGLQAEYYNRNLFRGAEKLRITATGRYERQLSGAGSGLSAYELDLEANLLFPKLVSPIGKASSGNLPQTKYRLQYRIYSQPNYYAQSAFSASYGYEWLYRDKIYNDLKIINLDYLRLLRSSERLQELIAADILTPESFADQVIIGPSYSVTYSPPTAEEQWLRFFVGGSVESSGNVLYGLNELFNFEKNAQGQYTFFSVPFAQYLRFQVDFRQYLQTSKYNRLVFRQNIGIGLPYSNSSELPFSKQFFVGGANSLRGFRPRSVGPGTYSGSSEDSFFDQTGDILIELNVEDRFDLGGYLEGALFADVGNVWLRNDKAARPGGAFDIGSFVDELAVSAGAGLRINLDFVLIRFDLAMPLRKPSRPNGERWVVDELSIDRNWRRENLILNVAIGYPF